MARVVFVTTSFPRDADDASGHFVRAHARQHAAEGHEVHVVTPDPRGVQAEEGLTVHGVAGHETFAWPGAAARLRSRPWRAHDVARFVVSARLATSALRADRIVAHWIVPSAWPIAPRGAPLEAWAHGADVRVLTALPAPLRARIVADVLRRAERVCFVAEPLRTSLLEALPRALAAALETRSAVEAAPIELPPRDRLPDAPTRWGLPARYVAWVGRDVPEKAPDLAVEAARLAGVPLVMVGTASAPPAPGVWRLGVLPRLDALAVIAHAAALLSTSRVEGAPTVVREARALGVSVVATPAGEISRWAERDEGIHLVGRAPEVIARALREAARSC